MFCIRPERAIDSFIAVWCTYIGLEGLVSGQDR